MSDQVATILWAVGGLMLIGLLVFVAIFVKFVAKAAFGYARAKPYAATIVFCVAGGVSSFVTAWFGAEMLIAALVGAVAGLATFLLVAVELGAD
jgi:hypothetical protein